MQVSFQIMKRYEYIISLLGYLADKYLFEYICWQFLTLQNVISAQWREYVATDPETLENKMTISFKCKKKVDNSLANDFSNYWVNQICRFEVLMHLAA